MAAILPRLFAPQLIILYALALSAWLIQLRGAVRFSFARQLTDHSTFTAPYNVWMYLFSKVPNKPYIPVEQVPELAKLKENWQVIRDEAVNLYGEGRIKVADAYNDAGFNSFFRSGWKRFYLKWYNDPQPSAERLCPQTVALLKSIPTIKGAMFASLDAGGRLVRHRDPYAGSLRYHLGLVTPTHPGECRIFVDGQPYTWRDGEDVLFDETFLHYAENTTDQTRIILFCDVERPLHTRVMTAINRWVAGTIIKESETVNEPGERVGFVNRLFCVVYQVRLVGKRFKAWNRGLYYTFKYATTALVVGGLVYWAVR